MVYTETDVCKFLWLPIFDFFILRTRMYYRLSMGHTHMQSPLVMPTRILDDECTRLELKLNNSKK